ncbi:MAG: hypothetical protein WBV82_09965 [Myxococcaceae bacterium]
MIRLDIEQARQEVAESLAELRIEVSRSVDWREWYRRRPGTILIGAFMVGFMIGYRRDDR